MTPSGAVAVRLSDLHKRFGEVQAVRGASLELRVGEIHALLGENGAGKTTLMTLLAGLHRPDAGQIEIFGKKVNFSNPRQAMDLGIGMVHQHFMLVPSLTGVENLLLGAARIPALLRPRRIEARLRARADALGLHLPLDLPVRELELGEQQRLEILRVLDRGARVMILDEPTAVLSPEDARALFVTLRRLTADGCAVVIISHKLEEVRRVADRITLMRRGQVVAHVDEPKAVPASELLAQMVGREVRPEPEHRPGRRGEPVLVAQNLDVPSERRGATIQGLDLTLFAGELLGLCGVGGNGQGELIRALCGLGLSSGRVILDGEEVGAADPAERARRGLRYVPADRLRTGSCPGLSVRENLLLRRYRQPPCGRGPWLDLRADDETLRAEVRAMDIATPGLEQRLGLLSGGNIQKVILARELFGSFRVLLCMQPTRGLDALATRTVHRRLLEARDRGVAVLLCSEDLDEILDLSDRIAVMAGGRITGLFDRCEADRQAIGRCMTGATRVER